ncbi:hypothetical protein LTR62_006188 [Meristemomyces frigidus]|uniref:Uncharacterized protein n=1 Tax=Meristemomyces frigidus TaxID=1508187 RepID=A0AAN7TNP3_9PEZI|nr:hypothetical protein LTR62_006188 [Meristemomyces frigidus]
MPAHRSSLSVSSYANRTAGYQPSFNNIPVATSTTFPAENEEEDDDGDNIVVASMPFKPPPKLSRSVRSAKHTEAIEISSSEYEETDPPNTVWRSEEEGEVSDESIVAPPRPLTPNTKRRRDSVTHDLPSRLSKKSKLTPGTPRPRQHYLHGLFSPRASPAVGGSKAFATGALQDTKKIVRPSAIVRTETVDAKVVGVGGEFTDLGSAAAAVGGRGRYEQTDVKVQEVSSSARKNVRKGASGAAAMPFLEIEDDSDQDKEAGAGVSRPLTLPPPVSSSAVLAGAVLAGEWKGSARALAARQKEQQRLMSRRLRIEATDRRQKQAAAAADDDDSDGSGDNDVVPVSVERLRLEAGKRSKSEAASDDGGGTRADIITGPVPRSSKISSPPSLGGKVVVTLPSQPATDAKAATNCMGSGRSMPNDPTHGLAESGGESIISLGVPEGTDMTTLLDGTAMSTLSESFSRTPEDLVEDEDKVDSVPVTAPRKLDLGPCSLGRRARQGVGQHGVCATPAIGPRRSQTTPIDAQATETRIPEAAANALYRLPGAIEQASTRMVDVRFERERGNRALKANKGKADEHLLRDQERRQREEGARNKRAGEEGESKRVNDEAEQKSGGAPEAKQEFDVVRRPLAGVSHVSDRLTSDHAAAPGRKNNFVQAPHADSVGVTNLETSKEDIHTAATTPSSKITTAPVTSRLPNTYNSSPAPFDPPAPSVDSTPPHAGIYVSPITSREERVRQKKERNARNQMLAGVEEDTALEVADGLVADVFPLPHSEDGVDTGASGSRHLSAGGQEPDDVFARLSDLLSNDAAPVSLSSSAAPAANNSSASTAEAPVSRESVLRNSTADTKAVPRSVIPTNEHAVYGYLSLNNPAGTGPIGRSYSGKNALATGESVRLSSSAATGAVLGSVPSTNDDIVHGPVTMNNSAGTGASSRWEPITSVTAPRAPVSLNSAAGTAATGRSKPVPGSSALSGLASSNGAAGSATVAPQDQVSHLDDPPFSFSDEYHKRRFGAKLKTICAPDIKLFMWSEEGLSKDEICQRHKQMTGKTRVYDTLRFRTRQIRETLFHLELAPGLLSRAADGEAWALDELNALVDARRPIFQKTTTDGFATAANNPRDSKLGTIKPEDVRVMRWVNEGVDWPTVIEEYEKLTGLKRHKNTVQKRHRLVKAAFQTACVEGRLLGRVMDGEAAALEELNRAVATSATPKGFVDTNLGEITAHDMQLLRWRESGTIFSQIAVQWQQLTGAERDLPWLWQRHKTVKAAIISITCEDALLDRACDGDRSAIEQLNRLVHSVWPVPAPVWRGRPRRELTAREGRIQTPPFDSFSMISSDERTHERTDEPWEKVMQRHIDQSANSSEGVDEHPTTGGKTLNAAMLLSYLRACEVEHKEQDAGPENQEVETSETRPKKEDQCHFNYQVQKRELSKEQAEDDGDDALSIERLPWLDCGNPFTGLLAANIEVNRQSLISNCPDTLLAFATNATQERNMDENGLASAVTTGNNAGVVEVQIERRMRAHGDGVVPDPGGYWAPRNIYFVKKSITTKSAPPKDLDNHDADLFGEDEPAEPIVVNVNEIVVGNKVYTTIEQANNAAIKYFTHEIQFPQNEFTHLNRRDSFIKEATSSFEVELREGRGRALFDQAVVSEDESEEVRVWVEAGKLEGPRNF